MNKSLILLFLLLSGTIAQAQQDTTRQQSVEHDYWTKDTAGELVVKEAEKISALMETINDSELPVEGFRIQLFFGRKEEVNGIRTEFLKQYPECRAYVSWLQPNFRLRIGDFRTRMQAERFKREIKADYPNSYIVRDIIEPQTQD